MIVTLQELKDHLRIETTDEDTYLTALLGRSEAACLAFCRRAAFDDTAPQEVAQAILIHAGYMHAYREGGEMDAHKTMTAVVQNLLWPYRDLTKIV